MKVFRFQNVSIIVGRTKMASSPVNGASGRNRDSIPSRGKQLLRRAGYLTVRALILYQMVK